MTLKTRAGRNKTITLTEEEIRKYSSLLISQIEKFSYAPTGIINGDCFEWAENLPEQFVDLLFLDPPYNMNKNFHGVQFTRQEIHEYTEWLDKVFDKLKPLLKKTASIYICGDWYSSTSIFEAASNHFIIRNRITWEREKGRGAKSNWKNSSEDIWFCTLSNDYTFNLDKVKLRRKVIAPYTENGNPKDWNKTKDGNFRDTHPSNIWTDITIPFWSMSENTDHPTQKSEKLLAKIILSSTNENDFILDPFMGSGTTLVTAKKLNRKFLGIDKNEQYCLLAEKRLELADTDTRIQGYSDGVFWERNTFPQQSRDDNDILNFFNE